MSLSDKIGRQVDRLSDEAEARFDGTVMIPDRWYESMCDLMVQVDRLESQLAAREWISVEDRLPPDSGDVLCHWTAYDIDTARLVHGGYWGKEGDNGEYYSVNAPTHWMKLPEPPKEASQ